jgi:hypothetical protein
VLPFRVLNPARFVIPLTQRGVLLDGNDPTIDAYPGLATWIREAEALWTERGRSKLTLAQQIDHMKKLTQQVPIPAVRGGLHQGGDACGGGSCH